MEGIELLSTKEGRESLGVVDVGLDMHKPIENAGERPRRDINTLKKQINKELDAYESRSERHHSKIVKLHELLKKAEADNEKTTNDPGILHRRRLSRKAHFERKKRRASKAPTVKPKTIKLQRSPKPSRIERVKLDGGVQCSMLNSCVVCEIYYTRKICQ